MAVSMAWQWAWQWAWQNDDGYDAPARLVQDVLKTRPAVPSKTEASVRLSPDTVVEAPVAEANGSFTSPAPRAVAFGASAAARARHGSTSACASATRSCCNPFPLFNNPAPQAEADTTKFASFGFLESLEVLKWSASICCEHFWSPPCAQRGRDGYDPARGATPRRYGPKACAQRGRRKTAPVGLPSRPIAGGAGKVRT